MSAGVIPPVNAPSTSLPRNTDPKTVLVGMAASVQNAILPAAAILFSGGAAGIFMLFPIVGAIVLVGTGFSYIRWKRLTYTVGEQDIRVESGVLSRAARSVPFERIQDVSLEQKLLPRLFGLVSVKFETGSGGGEDIALQFLTEEASEELRQLVRERRDDAPAPVAGPDGQTHAASQPSEDAQPLFRMGPGRLFTFGLFEFSLAVFAVLLGMLQYADNFLGSEIWNLDLWRGWISETGGEVATLDANLQLIGAISGVIGLVVIGSLTGMIRVFTREWGFLLERTARGFRRRRGLFTRTDVVMPIHRVQGITLVTGWLRYRFGWHGLSFVSLAQDTGTPGGASNHEVAPFAKIDEIAPIVTAAGFHLPGEDTDWRRASARYLIDGVIMETVFFVVVGAAAGTATALYAPEWFDLAVGAVLVIAGLLVIANVFSWRFKRHALDTAQIAVTSGVFAPSTSIAIRRKLHSVEISQGPIARLRGYATLHLGQAGGEFAIRGVPVERAREVRRKVLETIAATDFSQLERG